jgi:cysteine desulfurase / selenocysteine lyase
MNVDKIRNDIPEIENKLFFNSAGSSLMPNSVVIRMNSYIHEEQLYGGYSVGQKHEAELSEFYSEASILINCDANNIAFATSATDAYMKALSAFNFKIGDTILTSENDYISNQLAFISLRERYQINVIRAKNNEFGDLDLNDFEDQVKKHSPVLVSITHIPSSSGLIQPVEEVGQLCTKYDIWYLLDACQSVGHIKVDVKKIGCDFLSATGRKFLRGPRGTGFLFVSDEALASNLKPLFLDMRGAQWTSFDNYTLTNSAKRFEHWEFGYASQLGLKEAIKYANEVESSNIEKRNLQLSTKLRRGLETISGINVMDIGSALGSIVTINSEKETLSNIEHKLKSNKVYYSVGYKGNALIDFTNKGIDWVVRFSPHYFNTEKEVDQLIDLLY